MVSHAATSSTKMWQRCRRKKVRLGLRSPIFSTVARSSRKSSTSFFCGEMQEYVPTGQKIPQKPQEELLFRELLWQWGNAGGQSIQRHIFSSCIMTPSRQRLLGYFLSWLHLLSPFPPMGDWWAFLLRKSKQRGFNPNTKGFEILTFLLGSKLGWSGASSPIKSGLMYFFTNVLSRWNAMKGSWNTDIGTGW